MRDREVDGTVLDGSPSVSSREWLITFLMVCMEEGGSHGHELEKRIKEVGLWEVRPAEMYRTLGEMEGEDLISTEPGGAGPLRKSPELPFRKYRIAEPGKAYLEFWVDYLEDHQKAMILFLWMYDRKSEGLEDLSGDGTADG